MCKHVAAVLYGVGARFDQQPELLFTRRGVAAADLLSSTRTGLSAAGAAPASGKGPRQRGPGGRIRYRDRRRSEPVAAPPAARKRAGKESAARTSRVLTPSVPAKPAASAKSTSKGKIARTKLWSNPSLPQNLLVVRPARTRQRRPLQPSCKNHPHVPRRPPDPHRKAKTSR